MLPARIGSWRCLSACGREKNCWGQLLAKGNGGSDLQRNQKHGSKSEVTAAAWLPRVAGALTLFVLLVVAGCATNPSAPVAVAASGVSAAPDSNLTRRYAGMHCGQAVRASQKTIRELGYTVIDLRRPRDGQPGRIVGTVGIVTDEPAAVLDVDCDDAGVDIEVSTTLTGMDRFRFPARFDAVFDKHRSQRREVQRAARRAVAGKRAPERGLAVRVEPLDAGRCYADYGFDLGGSGLVAFRLTVENRTARHYRLQLSDVRFSSVEGKRALPVAGEVLQLSDPAATQKARAAAMSLEDIAAEAVREGLLYLPAAAYRRVSLQLEDIETEESEGFTIRF